MNVKELGNATAELRYVAVLFADLHGFTRLCERLDPEEVVEVLDVIFERLGIEAARYGGHVDKVLGDGLMVLFGAPQAREDDGLRAVLAGLAMQKAIGELQPWLRERLGYGLGMRVGIDAGPLVYGEVGPQECSRFTVIGDAANVAARLQRVAAPGQVVISERAQRLTARQIQFRKLGAVQLDGRAAPVVAYAAVAPFVPLSTASGASGNMIGRTAELTRLLSVYRQSTAHKLNLVLLTGESGIGKTRLLDEFASLMQASVQKPQPNVVRLFNRWEIGATYHPYNALAGLLSGRVAKSVGADMSSDNQAKEQAEEPSRLVERIKDICARQPLILAIDDWDWAAAKDGHNFQELIRLLSDLPVMMIISGRHVELQDSANFGSAAVHRLRLAPLINRDIWILLQQNPAFNALTPEMVDFIFERSGGNPAHVTLCMDMLVEQGLLMPSGSGWQATGERLSMLVPEVLTNSVLSRLDAISSEARFLLRVCAVIGRSFAIPTLLQVSNIEETALRNSLHGLIDAGLIVTTNTAEEAFQFRSELVRQVTYDTVLKRHRRELHMKAAEALENMADVPVTELGLHYVRAGVAEKAVKYGLSASSIMLNRGDHEDALSLLQMMESFIRDDDFAQRAIFLEKLGEAYVANGQFTEGLDRFLQALALIRDPIARSRLISDIGWAYALQGRIDMAAKNYQRAQDILATVEDKSQQPIVAAAMRLLYDRP